ncbi:PadR family transcriptional regulator [Shinella sp.]|uniref:PadR family transcriptional regulator n=1 Tax=Shinella sp. TaxID=1870904 RepID=UPI003F712191
MGCGPHRHFSPPDDRSGPFHRGRGGRHGGRLFDYGELRLLLLAIISDAPSHGYELIKTVEDRFGGSYSPSPGVIYPTLAWLDDMGYTVIEPAEGGRKRYRITPEGEAFLAANRAAIDELMARAGHRGPGGRDGVPAPVVRAMENLKLAMRLRLRRGEMSEEASEAIAAALDLAAKTVEKS